MDVNTAINHRDIMEMKQLFIVMDALQDHIQTTLTKLAKNAIIKQKGVYHASTTGILNPLFVNNAVQKMVIF